MPKKFSLVALASAAKLAVDKALPDRLLVVPWGETKTRKGLVVCNATTLAEMPGNQTREKYDRVALDFQHNTIKDGAEPKKVAGYGVPEIVQGEGIYLSSIEYTEDGKDLLAKGHYPDISPAVIRNDQGEVIFLHSVGACRQGEIDGLTLFSASDDLSLATFEAMDDTEPRGAGLRGILVDLINAMNPEGAIAEDATDADIASAARAAAAKMKDGDSEKVTALTSRLDAFEARFETQARNDLLDRAAREGKVVPLSADEIGKLELTALESMITNLPVTVPLESRLGGAIDDFRATPGQITPELREVARQMGVKPEDLV